MKIKSTMKYHLIAVRWLQLKRQQMASVGEDVEKREHCYTFGGNVNWCTHYGKL